jgi:hypothetical protein
MLERREAAGLAGALVAHAIALAFLVRAPGPQPGAPATSPVEVEVEPVTEAVAPSSSPVAGVQTPEPGLGARTERPRPTTRERDAAERAPPREEPSAAPAGTELPFTFDPTGRGSPSLSNEVLGLAGRNRFVGAVPDQAVSAPASPGGPANVAPGVDQSIRDALDARDHALGLDQGGPMVAVLEEVTRPSDTPSDGYAVFEVTVGPDGEVSDVRVVDANEARPAWERVAMDLRTTLRKRGIGLRRKSEKGAATTPEGKGRGMVVTLEVKSRWSLPSGAGDKRISGPYVKFGADPDTPVAAGGHFDVSDIGQRASRQVHARVVGERAF